MEMCPTCGCTVGGGCPESTREEKESYLWEYGRENAPVCGACGKTCRVIQVNARTGAITYVATCKCEESHNGDDPPP